MRRGCALFALMLLLCGCTSRIVENTEIAYRGTLTDHALAPMEEKSPSVFNESRAYIGIEAEDGTEHFFWLAEGYDPPTCFAGDTAEIVTAEEAGGGQRVIISLILLEKGDLHKHYETASWYEE